MDDHKVSDCSNCRNKGKYIYTSNFTGKRVISSVVPWGRVSEPCNELLERARNLYNVSDTTPILCVDYNPISTPKPPMDVKPRFIVADERLSELREGIQRCLDAYRQVPVEWIDEYNELVTYVDSREDKQ